MVARSKWIEGFSDTDDVRLRYVRTGGDLPAVVALHGLMGSGACWTPLARALENGFDVTMPDARGHGGSSASEHGYSYADHADDVVALLNTLGLSRPAILGHSMGGMTAAVVARRHPVNLRGLVLVDPTFLSPERQHDVWESDVAEQHRRALDLPRSELLFEARLRHPERPSETIEIQVEARRNTQMAALNVLAPPSPDYIDLMRAIEVPTLLIIGDSPVVSLEMATELRVLNPLVQIEQIPNAGHGVPFDQPETLHRITESFLRSLI